MPDRLVKALKLEDTNRFRLDLAEALGNITLSIHYLRSLVTWMVNSGACKFNSSIAKESFFSTVDALSELEEMLWELAPSRAALLELRKFRLTGELDPDFPVLFAKDNRGRIPETPSAAVNATQFEEVMKRLHDYEKYEANGKPPTVPD